MDGAMTTEHEALREDLPEYANGRLAPERAAAVERHLAGCAACRELLDDMKSLVESLRGGGDSLFEPHPEPEALQRFASGVAGEDESRIETHAAQCITCRLEIDVWRRRAPARRLSVATRPSEGGGRRAWPRLALAAAVGLIAGLMLAVPSRLWHPVVPQGPPASEPPGPSTPAPDPSVAIGPTVLHVLPGTLRDGQPARTRWVLDPDQPYIGIAFPVLVPADADDEEVYLLEIRPAGAAARWS